MVLSRRKTNDKSRKQALAARTWPFHRTLTHNSRTPGGVRARDYSEIARKSNFFLATVTTKLTAIAIVSRRLDKLHRVPLGTGRLDTSIGSPASVALSFHDNSTIDGRGRERERGTSEFCNVRISFTRYVANRQLRAFFSHHRTSPQYNVIIIGA